jgi:NAD(P)-dependent dehydrogenase (short-subunit alcohol dehydrogenase family)
MRNAELGTLIVTGASRGIGAGVAKLAAAAGYAVAVNFNSDEKKAQKVVDEIVASGGRAFAIQADVAREADIIRMFQTAERELGPIAALVNNAGITAGFARVDAVSADALQRAFAVNVIGRFVCHRNDLECWRRKVEPAPGSQLPIPSTWIRCTLNGVIPWFPKLPFADRPSFFPEGATRGANRATRARAGGGQFQWHAPTAYADF